MAATVAGVRSHRDHLDMAMHSAQGRRDPYPFFGELLARDEGCVLDDGRSFVYGYRQCTAVLRSPTFLKHGEHASSVPSGVTAEQAEILRRERPDAPGMLSSIDDPAHSRLRRLVSLAFTPRRLEPYVSLISKTPRPSDCRPARRAKWARSGSGRPISSPMRQDTFRARAFSEIPVVLEPS